MYKEIQNGAVAKSYTCMRKGFLIYEETRKYLTILRRPLVIYDFATRSISEFPYTVGGKFDFLFYQCREK